MPQPPGTGQDLKDGRRAGYSRSNAVERELGAGLCRLLRSLQLPALCVVQ